MHMSVLCAIGFEKTGKSLRVAIYLPGSVGWT